MIHLASSANIPARGPVRLWRLGLAAALCLPLLAGAADQKVYRWTDSEGKVHFGDRPPPGQEVDDITEEATAVNMDTSREARRELEKVFAEPSEAEEASRQQQEQEAAQQRRKQQAACRKARRQLKFFQEERFYWVDDQGNSWDASQEERQQTVEQLTAFLQRNC